MTKAEAAQNYMDVCEASRDVDKELWKLVRRMDRNPLKIKAYNHELHFVCLKKRRFEDKKKRILKKMQACD